MSNFPFKPRVVGWELTLRCNMSCIHCGSCAGKARPNEMTEEEGLSLIEQMVDLGLEVITLSGGEPLMHPSWPIYAKKLVDASVSTFMITNGLLLKDSIPKMKEVGLGRVGISFDGMEEKHNFIRNHKNSFAIALEAASEAISQGISVGAVTHVSKANREDLEDMYELFKKRGFSYWQIQLTFSQGRMKEHDDYSLAPEDMLDIAQFIYEKQQLEALQVVPGDNMGYYCSPPIRDKEWKGCFAGRHLMGVDADGAIKGCLSLPREFVEGNIREESLRTIWEDPERFKYNRYFSEDMLAGNCAGCEKARKCRGGCVVTANAATGNRFDNPYCVYKAVKQAKKG